MIKTATLQCVPVAISDQLISVPLKFRACYITGQWSQFRIEYATLCFFMLFVVFYHKICVVIVFISFFDEVSNFRNRILTNQKQELVIRNFQWNCMLWKCESMKRAWVCSPLVNLHLNLSSPSSRRDNKMFQNSFIS